MMLRATASFVLCVSCAILGSCTRTTATPPSDEHLREGIVARVGGIEIPVERVASIAATQKIDAESARDRAISDALFANEARSRSLDRVRSVELQTDAILARRLLVEMARSARKDGPVTDRELETMTRKYWLDLDRPVGLRVVHAVVRLDEKADDARRTRAAGIADAVRRAVSAASDLARVTVPPERAPIGRPKLTTEVPDPAAESFKKEASAVAHDGFEIVTEELSPMAPDGRIMQYGAGEYDPLFARAAAQMSKRGELTPTVNTSFGVHVIMLLEQTPPLVAAPEERQRFCYEEVMAQRVKDAQRVILDRLREGLSMDRNLDATLALVAIGQ